MKTLRVTNIFTENCRGIYLDYNNGNVVFEFKTTGLFEAGIGKRQIVQNKLRYCYYNRFNNEFFVIATVLRKRK